MAMFQLQSEPKQPVALGTQTPRVIIIIVVCRSLAAVFFGFGYSVFASFSFVYNMTSPFFCFLGTYFITPTLTHSHSWSRIIFLRWLGVYTIFLPLFGTVSLLATYSYYFSECLFFSMPSSFLFLC